ncbi:MAG: hypothetical protein ACKPKO_17025, partial [Candidatus Fonsibacter sp.]
MKDEINTLIMTEFIALNPKVYSINDQTLNEFNELEIKNKKTLKGVSKTVVKKEIKHEDYIQVKDTNKPIDKEVVSISSFNHNIYTYKQSKIALTSLYDKMRMVDSNSNIQFGYNPSTPHTHCCLQLHSPRPQCPGKNKHTTYLACESHAQGPL